METLEHTTQGASESKTNGAIITLRDSQRKAFLKLRHTDYGILNGPTGWGKSMVLCALAGDDLLSDPTRKEVVDHHLKGVCQ